MQSWLLREPEWEWIPAYPTFGDSKDSGKPTLPSQGWDCLSPRSPIQNGFSSDLPRQGVFMAKLFKPTFTWEEFEKPYPE